MGCGASRAQHYAETQTKLETQAKLNAEIAKIVKESVGQADRIPFYGTKPEDFRAGEQTIVSFPGVHGDGWKILTEVSSSKDTPFASTCIFLPDEKTKGYGQHDYPRGEHCNCHFLYDGKQKKWGCHWFSKWQVQTLIAKDTGCNLVVVTKKDGTLGKSQAGEVQFLKDRKIKYESITIEQFARRILDPTPIIRSLSKQKLEKQARKQQENKMRSEIEADVRREMERNMLLRRDSEEHGLDDLQYNAI
eukprot:s196_g34.t1